MTDEHKAALARGRTEGRAVREYLVALKAHRPKRGRRRTEETIAARLKAIEEQLADADALSELKLRQERRNLEQEMKQRSGGVDLQALEKAYISVAKSYGERQGISYQTWREQGVDAGVLKRAGISRSAG